MLKKIPFGLFRVDDIYTNSVKPSRKVIHFTPYALCSSVTQRIQRHYHNIENSVLNLYGKTASICDIKDFSGNITDGIRQCGARCGR